MKSTVKGKSFRDKLIRKKKCGYKRGDRRWEGKRWENFYFVNFFTFKLIFYDFKFLYKYLIKIESKKVIFACYLVEKKKFNRWLLKSRGKINFLKIA